MLFGKGRSTAEIMSIVLSLVDGGELERGEDCLGRRLRVRRAVNERCFKAEEKDLVAEAKTSPVAGRLDIKKYGTMVIFVIGSILTFAAFILHAEHVEDTTLCIDVDKYRHSVCLQSVVCTYIYTLVGSGPGFGYAFA